MNYPQELIDEVKKRSAGMRLEGINSGSGPKHPKLMIIGEAPGRNEIVNNIPFSGDAGKELNKSLAQIGLTRDDVYITSAVRSRPYAIKKVFSKRENKEVTKYPNRKPTKKEVLAHAPFLDYEIDYAQPKLIVALGNTGLERLLGPGHKISEEHGKVIENTPILRLNPQKDGYVWSKQKYTIFPEYHPAAVFYNRKLSDDIIKDWNIIKPYLEKEKVALNELRMDLDEHPLNQRKYTELAYLPGNSRKYSLNSVKTIESPLRHKKILFLGSSVTFGFGALGESFVDYLWKKDGIDAIKDADFGRSRYKLSW